jgi:hypothetical protein
MFGWPAILFSIALNAAGIALRSPWLAWAGSAVGLPPIWYLFIAAPRYRLLVLAMAGCYLSVGYALHRGHQWLAITLTLPFLMVFAVLGSMVLLQFR